MSATIKQTTAINVEIKTLKAEFEPAKPVQAKGKTKPSKTALSTEETAVFNKIIGPEGIEGLSAFDVSSKVEQAKRATRLLKTDPARANRIATGQEAPPPDILASAVYAAVETRAIKIGDAVTITSLATSGMSEQFTRFGQETSMLSTRNRYSPTGLVQDTINARKGTPTKKQAKAVVKAKKAVDKVDTKIAEKAVEAQTKAVPIPKVKTGKRANIKAKDYGKKNRLVTRAEYDTILAELKTEQGLLPGKQIKGTRRGGAFVPSGKDFKRMGKLATFHLEAIGRNFAEWSRVMKTQLGDWVVPHLQKAWNETIKKIGKADTELATSRIANGVKAGKTLDKMSVQIQLLAEGFVAQGIKKRGALIDAVHAVLVQVDPAITKRQTMDAILMSVNG